MGRGGGGGGGRSGGGSFSGGGSRSSGGRSSSGGGRSSNSGSSRSFNSGPSRNSGPRTPPPRMGPMRRPGYRPAPPPPGPGMRRPRYYGGYHGGHGRIGCLVLLIWSILFLVIFVSVIFRSFTGMFATGSAITNSTVERAPLDKQYVTTTVYYKDDIGWIGNATKLESGMKSFYQETGVQPFLYLTETVNGNGSPTGEEMDNFANELYDELFEDEGHLLLVFQEYQEDGNYMTWYVAGKQAKTVIDSEAGDILLDYIDHYYYSDLGEEEFFSESFRDAGERIMTKTQPPIVKVAVVIGVIAVIIILFLWWRKAKEQKNLEAEQTERILNADIDDLSGKDPELEDLENKYKT